MNKWVDVGSTTSAPNNGGALDYREVGQVFERVDQNSKWQSGFLQQSVSLRDLCQGRSEDLWTAVDVAPLLRLQSGHRRFDWLRRENVSVLKEVHTLLTPHLLEPGLSDR